MSNDPIDHPAQPEPAPAPVPEPAGESTDLPGVDARSSDTMVSDFARARPDQPVAADDDVEHSPEAAAEAPAAPAPESKVAPDARVRGKVTRLTSERVFVILEDGRQGFVQMIEFVAQPIPREGDQVSVIPEGQDAASGLLLLSKRQADELSFWQSVQPGDELEGVVTGMNKGGLDVDIGGARAFLPASQVDIHRIRDISMLIGEHVRCIVTQVDRTTHDLVLSRRKSLEKERKQARVRALESLVEGQTRNGTVSSITDYGAFIDLGGIEGLLHVNDMSWSHVRHPKDVVQQGQQLELQVTKVNRETGKVSLGLKQLQPDPWANIADKYPADKRLKARVARLADFGAFLELEAGVDGLLPLSEMSWSRRINHPSELLKVGDEPEVVVLKVDAAKRRISLGLKQTEPNPWTTVQERFPVDAKVTGKVSKTADFGAFVELTPGVEGLVHISELADKRVNSVTDIVQEGQEVQVRVLKVDIEAQRISLSMRTDRQAARAVHGEPPSDKSKKKHKKPLRGGLAGHFQWW